MNYYLNEENCYKRLLTEYKKYGTIIVAVDYDGTINDFHNEGLTFDNMISLLRKCNKIGFKIEGINKQLLPQFEGRGKLYYNILMDDRAGLPSTYRILRRLVEDEYFQED